MEALELGEKLKNIPFLMLHYDIVRIFFVQNYNRNNILFVQGILSPLFKILLVQDKTQLNQQITPLN